MKMPKSASGVLIPILGQNKGDLEWVKVDLGYYASGRTEVWILVDRACDEMGYV